MAIPSAAALRQLQLERVSRLVEIERKIDEHIKKGLDKQEIEMFFVINTSDKEHLQALGYQIRSEGSSTIISWEA